MSKKRWIGGFIWEYKSQEFKEFKDFVENDNFIIEVKNNLLIKLKESCNELQSQIDELKKIKNK